ncbi:hypothetical protein [Luteimicrobium sp. DT211]|uniref:hypothetical protein n=1 Tax=Luteimicrobium sp. DT211 TaxID=3393412 RepID=UPI003CFB7A3D
MAQWEDDLRAVVEHRGAALVARARTLVASDDDASRDDAHDPAVDLTVDALAAAFRRGRRSSDDQGSVRLVTDDDLDALEAAVHREQDRLAPARGPSIPTARPDDGPSDALSARLPEVVAQVRAARRRGRRRALVAGAAVVVVAALATTAFAARPWDRAPDPRGTDTPYAGACGATLPDGTSLLPVALSDEESADGILLPDQTWFATYDGDMSALTPDDRELLGTFDPEVVLTSDGTVVALGVSTGEVTYDDPADGSRTVAPPWPGLADRGDPGDVSRLADYADDGGGSTQVAVRFVPCGGGDLPAGDYRAYLYGSAADGSAHVLSDPSPVLVLAATPAGYQPPWLEGSALACGESVDEFLTRISTRPVVDLDERRVAVHDDGVSYRLRNDADTDLRISLPTHVAMAWTQGGTIVGVGTDERRSAPTTVKAGATVTLSARPWDTHDYCGTGAGSAPSSRLPAGTYQVFGYARVPAHEPGEPDAWFFEGTGPSSVVVREDGSVTYG